MDKVEVNSTLGISIMLANAVNDILYEKVKTKEGKELRVARKLPFRLSYRLERNKTALDRDVQLFEDRKMFLLAQFGELTEDEKNVVIKDPEKITKYSEALRATLNTPIKRSIIKVEPEDLDLVTENIDIAPEALKAFIIYMTADEELLADLATTISFDLVSNKSDSETTKTDIESTETT